MLRRVHARHAHCLSPRRAEMFHGGRKVQTPACLGNTAVDSLAAVRLSRALIGWWTSCMQCRRRFVTRVHKVPWCPWARCVDQYAQAGYAIRCCYDCCTWGSGRWTGVNLTFSGCSCHRICTKDVSEAVRRRGQRGWGTYVEPGVFHPRTVVAVQLHVEVVEEFGYHELRLRQRHQLSQAVARTQAEGPEDVFGRGSMRFAAVLSEPSLRPEFFGVVEKPFRATHEPGYRKLSPSTLPGTSTGSQGQVRGCLPLSHGYICLMTSSQPKAPLHL